MSITKKYGDAAVQAKAALADGVDLVVGYGGDGTQHELANAVLEAADASASPARIGILPGGTGNGFAREMGVPGTLRDATEVLCPSPGSGPSTLAGCSRSRTSTSRIATSSSGCTWARARGADEPRARRTATACPRVCGQPGPARAGRPRSVPRRGGRRGPRVPGVQGLRGELRDDGHRPEITHGYCGRRRPARRLRDRRTQRATRWSRRRRGSWPCTRRAPPATTVRPGPSASRPSPDQPVWADGEYIGRTPISIEVAPRALSVVVP